MIISFIAMVLTMNVNEHGLKNILHSGQLSKSEQVLLCLACGGPKPKTVSEIKTVGLKVGLRRMRGWNISAMLSDLNGKAIRIDAGWELTLEGKRAVRLLTGATDAGSKPLAAAGLRAFLDKLSDPHTKSFLSEAIECYECDLHRAAVVLSWVGAISLLYRFVLTHRLDDFNHEARRRDNKWHDASIMDDLARMKEHDFLQILERLSIIGKSVKSELEQALKLRNSCGHPNSLVIAAHRVAAHIEVLTLNVFSRFVP